MRIEYTDRDGSTTLYAEESSVPLVPRVGEDVEIAQTSYTVSAVIWVVDEGTIQVRLR